MKSCFYKLKRQCFAVFAQSAVILNLAYESMCDVLTRHTQEMQGLSVMLGMCRTSPSFSQLASVPEEEEEKKTFFNTTISPNPRYLTVLFVFK